jgi:hypothetical protein
VPDFVSLAGSELTTVSPTTETELGDHEIKIELSDPLKLTKTYTITLSVVTPEEEEQATEEETTDESASEETTDEPVDAP